MPPHQQRVIDEKTELDIKRDALTKFIETSPVFEALGADERRRLIEQNGVMSRYSQILTDRISYFAA